MSDELKQAVAEILEHVGKERLARNYNLTSMEIPGDMLRRLMQASAASRAVSASAGTLLGDAIYAMNMGRVGLGHGPGTRELALAVTNAETAELWLKRSEEVRRREETSETKSGA